MRGKENYEMMSDVLSLRVKDRVRVGLGLLDKKNLVRKNKLQRATNLVVAVRIYLGLGYWDPPKGGTYP